MARDFSDLYDFSSMTDDEIYDVVVQELSEYPNLDTGWIEVTVHGGHVTLAGRVGSDAEVRVAEQVVGEVLGIESLTNNLVVDELHRETLPEAADEAAAEADELDDQLGGSTQQDNQSDTASHLVEDLEAETYGTHDMQEAIEEGTAYEPPDRPVADGYESRENH
jgi:hypothetical protein